MLEELFLYTKLTSEEFELTIQDLQALPLLSDCLIGLYHRFEAAGLSPEVEIEEEGVRVWADEEALRRVFHNLIQNALVHGAGGIVIRQKQVAFSSNLFSAATEKVVRPEVSQLESEADRSMVCLVFENRISPDDKPDPARLFERFYKADSARHRGSSGLGLFIVKELVERMGGGVSARLEGDKLQIAVYLQESLA